MGDANKDEEGIKNKDKETRILPLNWSLADKRIKKI